MGRVTFNVLNSLSIPFRLAKQDLQNVAKEHDAYKKVKMLCNKQQNDIELVAEQPGKILTTMSSGNKDTAQGTKDKTREG